MKGSLLLAAFTLCMAFTAKAKDIMLTEQNFCSLEGPVTRQSVNELKICLTEQVTKRGLRPYPIYIYLHSPGGSVYSGLKFIEYAKNFNNVHTITSYAASMAAGIVEHLPGKRYITPSGIMMFHRARGSVKGQLETGELEKRLAFWKKIIRGMEKKQANRIGITLREYKKRIKDEWWLYSEDSIKANASDEIANVTCTKKLSKIKVKRKVLSFFGTRETEVYKCPVLN